MFACVSTYIILLVTICEKVMLISKHKLFLGHPVDLVISPWFAILDLVVSQYYASLNVVISPCCAIIDLVDLVEILLI